LLGKLRQQVAYLRHTRPRRAAVSGLNQIKLRSSSSDYRQDRNSIPSAPCGAASKVLGRRFGLRAISIKPEQPSEAAERQTTLN
jgi:hypothetical protein